MATAWSARITAKAKLCVGIKKVDYLEPPMLIASGAIWKIQINYFALIARIQVKEGMVDQCVDLAETADKAVEASE